MLKDQGIDRGEIVGFYAEEFTHLAAAVASGMADVAIGIEAAAVKLALEFVPMFTEDYYLLAKRESLEQKNMRNGSRCSPARLFVLSSKAYRDTMQVAPAQSRQSARRLNARHRQNPNAEHPE